MITALGITNCIFPETMVLIIKVTQDVVNKVETSINWKDQAFYTIIEFLHAQATVVRPDSNEVFDSIVWCFDKPCWRNKSETVHWSKTFMRKDIDTERPMQFPVNHDYDLVDSDLPFDNMMDNTADWITKHGGPLKNSATRTFPRATQFSCCHTGAGLEKFKTQPQQAALKVKVRTFYSEISTLFPCATFTRFDRYPQEPDYVRNLKQKLRKF